MTLKYYAMPFDVTIRPATRMLFMNPEFKGAVSFRFSQGLFTLMCNENKRYINFFFFFA